MRQEISLALAGMAAYIAAMTRATAQPGSKLIAIPDLERLVGIINQLLPSPVDPLMVMAMVEIESGRNPYASRYEAHIPDYSIGLMQTLTITARDLYQKGYREKGHPSKASLLDPGTSLYFGMAYIHWLRRHPRFDGSERWIVESYNGGPGNSNAMTQRHYAKYLAAKARLEAQ